MIWLKVSFDLKILRLWGDNWKRENDPLLAKQLLDKQGSYRTSIENRLYIIFDKSPNAKVRLLQLNEEKMKKKLYDVCSNPQKHWFYIEYYRVWACIIWFKRGEYKQSIIDYNLEYHPLGNGLREREKSDFEHDFLIKAAVIINNLTVNANKKEYGVNGWIDF